MTPENIEAIASKYAQMHNERIILQAITLAINEAFDLEDKSKWKYPDKGELPEEHRDLLFVYKKERLMRHGYYFNNHWYMYEYSTHGSVSSAVKAWTYASIPKD